MASALLKGYIFFVIRPSKHFKACGCQHIYTLGSSDDDGEKTRTKPHGTTLARRRYGSISVRPPNTSWAVSTIYNKSGFLHSTPIFTNLNLCEDLLIKRPFHSTIRVFKEDTVVEKSLKKLKNDAKLKRKPVHSEVKQNIFRVYAVKIYTKWSNLITFLRENGIRGVLKHFIESMKFYKDGFKLFWKDLRICVPLTFKYLTKGRSSLTRKEYRLLKQTLVDLLLMFPILPTLIIPFMEILIPVFLWIGMIPQVFIPKATRDAKQHAKLQRKIEAAKLLVDSLNDMPLRSKSKKNGTVSTMQEFTEFMEKVKNNEVIPPIAQILQFSRLFENSLTLDDLSVEQLQRLCKLLGIGFLSEIPSSRALRFQIDMRMRELTVDDKFILRDGIDSLTTEELQAANRARGMRALGVAEDRLRIQLEQWIELHLKEEVPTTLLLLSRIMYLDENLSPAEQLKEAISSLPETTVDKVKVASAESSSEVVDKKTKIKVLDEEMKAIQLEKEEAEQEERLLKEKMEAQQEMDEEREIKEDVKPIPDIAEPIIAQPSEEPVDTAKEIEEEGITTQDLEDIEKAIEDQARHYTVEIAEVAEDIDEYKEDVEDIKAICAKTDVEKEVEETLNAKLLLKRLDKLMQQFDQTIDKLHEEKMQIQEKIDRDEVALKYDRDNKRETILKEISEKKSNLISVNDILLSLKRLQKVPDDVRMQKVLEVLDTDKDGLIDINQVLKVTEALSRENLKLNKNQVQSMMDLVAKEEELEEVEKIKDKEETELLKKQTDTPPDKPEDQPPTNGSP